MKKTIAIILLATIAITSLFALNTGDIDKKNLATPLLALANTLDQQGMKYSIWQSTSTGVYIIEVEDFYGEAFTVDIFYDAEFETLDFYYFNLYTFNPDDYLWAIYLINRENSTSLNFASFYYDDEDSTLNAVTSLSLLGVADYGKFIFDNLDWQMFVVGDSTTSIINNYLNI